MLRKAKAAVAFGATTAAAAMLLCGQAAIADPQARPSDAVGVGSDTLQFAADFLADGDVSGHAGYNALVRNRMITEFATGDGNGRAMYDARGNILYGNGTTALVLRAGTKPVERPDGSGAGAKALIADSVGGVGYQGLPNGSFNFARMSRLPSTTEQSNCAAITDCGGLHVFQFATDLLQVAVSSTGTNAFPMSAQQLAAIYNCSARTWNAVPGAPAGASTDTIDPVIPQSGSGTHDFFLADIGLSSVGSCVRVSQEHDPTGVTLAANPADAIEPFSSGKIKLINSGYFTNSQEPASDFNIATISTGTPNDGNPLYNSTRGLYFVVRDFDLTTTTPFQPGGTANIAKTLFSGSTSWIARSANAALIQAAGFTPAYADLGDAHS